MIKWRIVSGSYNSIHEIVGKVTIEIKQDGAINPVLSCDILYCSYTEKGFQSIKEGEIISCKQPLSAASRAAFPVQSGPY